MRFVPRISALLSLALAGCAVNATIIPTEGPLASAGAAPFVAKIKDVQRFNGTLEATLPSGEYVSGEWQAVSTGFGTRQVYAIGRGNRGTILHFDAQTDSSARGIGGGRDNKGNVYRVMLKGI